MAKATLATNFQDDILNSSMGSKRRYKLIQNSDGTVSLEDVSTYNQVGSEYGAGQVNAQNTAINASADAGKIIDSLSTIEANTQSGYITGALAVKELNNNLIAIKDLLLKTYTTETKTVNAGSNQTFTIDCNIDGYRPISLTAVIPTDYACTLSAFNISAGNYVSIGVRNVISNNINCKIEFSVLYMKL